MTAGSRRSAFAQFRRLGNTMLGRLGLRITRIGANLADCRDAGDALEASYRASGAPFVFNFPLAHCRILPASGFACVTGAGNPLVDTLQGYGHGTMQAYPDTPLQRYFQHWVPRNAAEVLGLAGENVSPRLATAPPLGFVMPWGRMDPAQAASYWQGVVKADHREHGGSADPAQGWKGWGPVSDEVGQLEFRRLAAVHDSIKQHGYQRNDSDDGDMGGVLLWTDGECRLLVTKGHHRAAALCALGHEVAPFRIQPGDLIRRNEVDHWPNVRSGLFSRDQALEIFDRLHAGRQQPQYAQSR